MQRHMEQLAHAMKPTPMESTRIEEAEPFQVILTCFVCFILKSLLKIKFSYEQR